LRRSAHGAFSGSRRTPGGGAFSGGLDYFVVRVAEARRSDGKQSVICLTGLRFLKNKNLELQRVKSVLIDAVAELDLRGTNQTVTEALCIINAVMDRSISGKVLPPNKAFMIGKAMARDLISFHESGIT
jgi:hypothetical protein